MLAELEVESPGMSSVGAYLDPATTIAIREKRAETFVVSITTTRPLGHGLPLIQLMLVRPADCLEAALCHKQFGNSVRRSNRCFFFPSVEEMQLRLLNFW